MKANVLASRKRDWGITPTSPATGAAGDSLFAEVFSAWDTVNIPAKQLLHRLLRYFCGIDCLFCPYIWKEREIKIGREERAVLLWPTHAAARFG